jgi:anti-sigma factor RsiW
MDHLQAVNTLASERYLLGEMTELEQHAFEDHYFDCPECAEGVRLGGLMSDAVRSGLLDAPRVSTLQPRRPALQVWHRSVALPWATAATLALVAGYQSLAVVPALRRQTAPQALSPITLRPASRGQEATVAMPVTGGAVTLAIDVGAASPSGRLHYELRRVDGTGVASGIVLAPRAGSPLLLLVPASLLGPTGHYVLSVHDSVNSGLTVEDYRFTVEGQ